MGFLFLLTLWNFSTIINKERFKMTTNKKWTDEAVATLNAAVVAGTDVSADTVNTLATSLGFTARSVASKFRQMGVAVASMAATKAPAFTEAEGNALRAFVQANAGNLTYKEIAENFNEGKFNAKQVQGKILALELTGSVKATEKAEAVRTYTDAEEAKFLEMVEDGAFIEDIAAALGKTVASIRGKALSLTRQEKIAAIPQQKESHAKDNVDPVEALGDGLAKMTVAEIATATGKTDRGIKTLLTRRGIDVADYKGAAKAAKNAEKLAA